MNETVGWAFSHFQHENEIAMAKEKNSMATTVP